MFTNGKRTGHSPARKSRRHKLAIGASAAGALAVVAFASAAGAATPPANVNYPAAAANNTIVGSGSSTTYNMMQSLDTLFNQTPGCVITSGSVAGSPAKGSQELNYACETNSSNVTLQQVAGNDSYLDNPINDVAVEQPPMGSSNGIAQLELGRNQANTGIGTSFTSSNQENVSAINFARSSRDPSGANDVAGLNFVAYAKDGVAPLIFTEFNGTKTPQFALAASTGSGLSTAQLQDIYNGTIYDWGQLGAKSSAPIYVYSAQEGSGTQSTFKTFLGFDPSAATEKVNCTDPVPFGSKVSAGPTETDGVTTQVGAGKTAAAWPAAPTTGCLGPDVIFENEDASILANASSATEDATATAWHTLNPSGSPVGDSAFFYSFGKFNLQCEGLKSQITYLDKSKSAITNVKAGTNCGSEAIPATLGKTTLGLTPVNGVDPNAETILGANGTVYPIDRFLYNVYSNGSNANLPEATAATLNYVSEVGFLCKPQTIDGTTNDVASNEITDPATGVWYHTEIFDTIIANGFIPVTAKDSETGFADLTDGAPNPENAAGATHTAYSLLSAADGSSTYGATYLSAAPSGQTSNTSIPTSANPSGYCILTTTDGNTNS
jgi:ABC-type phosphate transport system substrate-binding protein